MTMGSAMEVVRYQRNIGAVPQRDSFSVRTNWGRQIEALGGSRKYIASYKGVTTYVALIGVQGRTGLKMGVLAGLLNGSQSDFWTELINSMQTVTQSAENNGNIKLALESFWLTSPSGDVSTIVGALQVALQLVTDLANNDSATASGQFRLDVQNAISVNPFGLLDPKPVFDWAVTLSVDGSTDSITLAINTAYDHMENNTVLEDIAGIIVGVITAGLLGPVVGTIGGAGGGVASGIAVGAALNQAYDAAANNKLLDFLAHDLALQPWTQSTGPIMLKASHPTTREYVLSMTLHLDSTAFQQFTTIGGQVLALAELLGVVSTAF